MAYCLTKETKTIRGRVCHIYTFGTGSDAVILWGTFPHTGKEEESLLITLSRLCGQKNFTLIAYFVNNWNAEFSPWKAQDSKGNEVFTGKGKETLAWIQDYALRYINHNFEEDIPVFLTGYSLAGLFSLWAFYESNNFTGVACCSGSLWMDGWKDYIIDKSVPSDSLVYLSLGGKEEKTNDPKMATVGDRTREQEQKMKRDSNVKECILEWNKGGHFADSGKRVAKGICWLLEKWNEEPL